MDDVFAWVVGQMRKAKASDRLITTMKEKLDAAIPVGKAGKLVEAVNALSLAALEEKDIFEQYEVERLASSVLKKGLDEARNNNNSITAAS